MNLRIKRTICSIVIVALMVSTLALVGKVRSLNSGIIPEGEFTDYFHDLTTADTVYEIDASDEELWTAVSLQGILAQKEARIIINPPEDWKNIMISDYGIEFVSIGLWDAVEKFKGELNGIVTFQKYDAASSDLYPEISSSSNKACMLSAMEQYLMVEESLLEKAESLGLEKKADAVTDYEREIDIFREYKDEMNSKYIVQQAYDNTGVRDLGIALKAPFFAASDEDELREIYEWVDDCGVSLGWHNEEVAGVGMASQYGIMTLPSDHAANLSVYAGLPNEKLRQKPYIARERDSKNTHYVTFLLSDGDNLQLHVNSYRTGNFASSVRGSIPFGWSTSPSLASMAPNIQKWYYKEATNNDDFIAAVSGVGYVNPALMPAESLKKYTQITADYMRQNDIATTVLLMDTPEEMLIDPEETQINTLFDITKDFAEHKAIKGGFLYYGNLYCPVRTPGAVFWNYGKPFVAIRETLWGQGEKSQAMEKMAYRINHYTKDATKVEGYTAINVQYWEYSIDDVAKMVEMFDDDVVVVTPREFVDIMSRNVTDKTTKLELDDLYAYDWDEIFGENYQSTAWLDMDAIESQPVSDKLDFDFSLGMEGWKARIGGAAYDKAQLQIESGKKVLSTDGSKFGSDDPVPNAYFFNKVKLPDKSKVVMKINAKYNDSAVRVQVLDSAGKLHTVQDYIVKNNDYETWEVDLSEFSGQTVTVIYQGRDSCGIEGSQGSGTGEVSYISRITFE